MCEKFDVLTADLDEMKTNIHSIQADTRAKKEQRKKASQLAADTKRAKKEQEEKFRIEYEFDRRSITNHYNYRQEIREKEEALAAAASKKAKTKKLPTVAPSAAKKPKLSVPEDDE